jgi:hypothetical protein
MRRLLPECWRALRAPVLKLSPGSALVLVSVAGTLLAAILWLEVSLTAAAITYAVTLGVVLMILYGQSRMEARAMKRAKGDIASGSRGTSDCTTKKIISSR